MSSSVFVPLRCWVATLLRRPAPQVPGIQVWMRRACGWHWSILAAVVMLTNNNLKRRSLQITTFGAKWLVACACRRRRLEGQLSPLLWGFLKMGSNRNYGEALESICSWHGVVLLDRYCIITVAGLMLAFIYMYLLYFNVLPLYYTCKLCTYIYICIYIYVHSTW